MEVKRLKGATSRYLRLEFPHLKRKLPSLLTNSYFVRERASLTIKCNFPPFEGKPHSCPGRL